MSTCECFSGDVWPVSVTFHLPVGGQRGLTCDPLFTHLWLTRQRTKTPYRPGPEYTSYKTFMGPLELTLCSASIQDSFFQAD